VFHQNEFANWLRREWQIPKVWRVQTDIKLQANANIHTATLTVQLEKFYYFFTQGFEFLSATSIHCFRNPIALRHALLRNGNLHRSSFTVTILPFYLSYDLNSLPLHS
jgi:hypothetical protein